MDPKLAADEELARLWYGGYEQRAERVTDTDQPYRGRCPEGVGIAGGFFDGELVSVPGEDTAEFIVEMALRRTGQSLEHYRRCTRPRKGL